MKHKISKAAAALAVAIAAVFAAPAVASAYTPDTPVPSALVPGVPAPFPVPAGTFVPGETVTFTLTGEGVGPDNLAFVAFAVSSASVDKTATADGGAVATVTLPEDATGSYALTAVSESGASFAFPAVGVAAAAGGDGGGTDDGGAGGPALGNTGFDGDALLGLWVGGGVLVLAGASIAVATSVRRTRRA
ncbi:hypothetical protein Q9S71_07645 [Microbacterium sp. KSW4-11]|uniref:Sortase n=1 Tax=Microbacterium gawkjiense TaxID=3067309 RepID=A0ABU3GCF8_9MICO|nr:hypothetical protein [Microbacterium sp. KSW4-11]MDT3316697.1 hypothetical protein [Microbacterium sp. KSW4-11]